MKNDEEFSNYEKEGILSVLLIEFCTNIGRLVPEDFSSVSIPRLVPNYFFMDDIPILYAKGFSIKEISEITEYGVVYVSLALGYEKLFTLFVNGRDVGIDQIL